MPKWAQGGVAWVEGVVEGGDMEPMVVELEIGSDSLVRGVFEGVPPGSRRKVTLNAYDEAGELLYSGSADTDIVAGETTVLTITLRWVSLLGGQSFDLPGGAQMEFVWIEPGTFTMGSPAAETGRSDHEGPQHEVAISQGFYLGTFAITQAQWEAVIGTRPWQGGSNVQDNPDHPAVYISWDWVADWYDSGYYSQSPSIDPQGPSSGSTRVVRGGAFRNGALLLRSAGRFSGSPSAPGSIVGARLVRTQ